MITLNLSQKQYDVIKTALVHYADHMNGVLQAYLDSAQKKEPQPIAVHHSMVGKSEAPWGLKKDGTPRARPGRKSVRKVRA